MDIPETLRRAREEAGLSQSALAARAGPAEATISASDGCPTQPAVETRGRLLAATGRRLTAERALPREPSPSEHARTARALVDVLALAGALPSRQRGVLRYPRLA